MIISKIIVSCFLSIALCTNSVCNIASGNGGQPYCENGLRTPCSVSNKVNTDALVDATIGFAVGAFATWLPSGVGPIKSFLNPMMGSSLKAMRAFTSEGPSTCDREIIDWVAANFITIADFNQFKEDVNANFLINNIATDFLEMDNERYKAELHSEDLMDDMTDASALGTYVQHLVKVADEARFAIADATDSLVNNDIDASAIQAALVYIIEGAKVGFQALTAAYAIIPYCWFHDNNENCDPSYFLNELEDFKSKIETAKAAITSTVYEKLRAERENINRLSFKTYSQKRESKCLSCRDWKETEWCGDNDAGCGQIDDSEEDWWPADDRRRRLQSTYTVAQCSFMTQFTAGDCYFEDLAFKTGAYAYQEVRWQRQSEAKGTSAHLDKCWVTNFASNKYDPKCSDSKINTNSCSGSLTSRKGSSSCTSAVKTNLRDRLADEYEAELVSLTSQLFTVEERLSAPVEVTLRGSTGLEQITITDSEGTEHITHQRVAEEGSVFRFNVPTSGIFYMQWDLTINPASQGYLVDSSVDFVNEQTTFTNENRITFQMPPTTEYLAAPSGEMSEIIGKMMQDMFFDLSSLPAEEEIDVGLSGLLATPESWFSNDDGTYVNTDVDGEVALPIHQACSPPESPDVQTGKACPVGNCLNKNTPYDTLYEAWQACSVVYECGHVMLWTNGKYFLRRLSDPTSSLGKLYTYECSAKSYNDAHYHVEIEGWEPATFNLRGASGTEEITITSGTYVLSTTLTKEYQSFVVPLTKSGTFKIDFDDGKGKDVFLTSDIDYDISLPNAWKGWGCGLTKLEENYRCDRVRTGVMAWRGPYVVSMPKIDATQEQENDIPSCAQSGIDFVGNDLSLIRGVETAVACQKRCLIRNGCEFFTFVPSNGNCFLKTSDTGSTAISDRISGPAVCYGGLTSKKCGNEHYSCDSQTEAEAVCNAEGLTLCTEGQVAAFGTGPCAYMWTSSSSTLGMYVGLGTNQCGTEGTMQKTTTSYKGTGKFDAACCQPADRYIRVEGTCPDTCNTITSVEACSAAGRAMGLGVVRVQHQSGRLPGCFFYEPTAYVEFNADLESTTDWGNTDSLCDCRAFSDSAPFTAEMYGEELEGGSKGIVTGEGSAKNMLRIQATTQYATLNGISIKKSIL